MNDEEIAVLLRMVKAICPAQRVDEWTPDAWLLVLDDVSFDDARASLKPLALAQPFIAPTDVAQHVKRVRRARLESVVEPIPNPVEGVSYGHELRALRRAIADGLINGEQDAEAYRQWGGSLHLVYERGETPELTAASNTQPLRTRAVAHAITAAFQQVPER